MPRPASGRFWQVHKPREGDCRWIFVAIALAALLVRLAPLLRGGIAWAIKGDSLGYIQLAKGLLAGCGFAQLVDAACGGPDLFRTPGYPVFLALMPSLRLAIVAQAVAGALVCLLIGVFVGGRWGVTAGAVAEVLLALDAPSILHSAYILSDSLFSALLAIAVVVQLWVISRALFDLKAISLTLLAALLFALAVLVRPIGQFLPLFAPLPFLLVPGVKWRKRMALSLLALAIPTVAICTWAERNRKAAGAWTFSTVGVYELYYSRAAGVIWYRSHQSLDAIREGLWQSLGLQLQGWWQTPYTFVKEMRDRGLKIICSDPMALIAMSAESLVYLAVTPDRTDLQTFLRTKGGAADYYKPLSSIGTRIKELLESPMLTILVGVQLILTALMWIGVAIALKRLDWRSGADRAFILIPFCLSLVLLSLAAGPEAGARYRVPTIPLLAMLSAIGWFGGQKMTTGAPPAK